MNPASPSIPVVSLADKFSRITDYWHPRIAGQVNDFHLKLARLKGEFIWHHHDTEDELFLVVSGRLRIQLRDGELLIAPGEFVIIPHGVEHRPVADDEVQVVLLEPAGTLNTGLEGDERTVDPDWI